MRGSNCQEVSAMVTESRRHAFHAYQKERLRKNNPRYGAERFTYVPESNSCGRPAEEQLNHVGLNVSVLTKAQSAQQNSF